MKTKNKQTKNPVDFYDYIPTMQPSYADLAEVIQLHGGKTFADIKYDGYRIQIHKGKDAVKIYTRNANELNYKCYPEIIEAVSLLPVCVIDAELVGSGNSHKEMFDNVKKRFRRDGIRDEAVDKYLDSGIIGDIPLHLRVFETLNYENNWLMNLPLEERRKFTEKFDGKSMKPSETTIMNSKKELEDLIAQTFRNKQEGRVCKAPTSIYIPGGNGTEWVKFKRSESLDLVVVGVYDDAYGLNIPFGAVLCATYNDKTEQYETIGKIGVTRENFAALINNEIKQNLTAKPSPNIVLSDKLQKEGNKKFVPNRYVNPELSVVIEVKAMNLNYSDNWQTCGYDAGKAFSMRIGFMQQVRYDKNPRQATKTSVVQKLYNLQENVE